jgi:hypothetical protein
MQLAMNEPPHIPTSEQYLIRRAFFGDRIVYKELFGGCWRKLNVPAEDRGRGRFKYKIMSDEVWRAQMPEWAWNRKDDIEFRIVSDIICDHD